MRGLCSTPFRSNLSYCPFLTLMMVLQAIELISVLVDSFSTQIILDEKHHSTITKAVELTSGLVSSLLFT